MTKNTGLYSADLWVCPVCGERKGLYGIDHTECSKIRQEEHKNDRRRAARKKMSKAEIDYLCKIAENS